MFPRGVFSLLLLLACSTAFSTLSACSSTSMAIKEKFGYAKREQLVDNVKEARDSQVEAKEQFESALAEFLAVTGQQGKQGELETRYNALKKENDRSVDRAEAVESRIKDVERVGEALFKEWKSELASYKSASLRASSERQMEDTRAQYDQLVGAMKAAASKMDPVLEAMNDQVLFLKHNLNAQAIASLGGTAAQIQTDVTALIRDMEAAIAEADRFIQNMDRAPAPPADTGAAASASRNTV